MAKKFKPTSTPSNQQLWLYGKHPVSSALKNKQRKIFRLLLTRDNEEWLNQQNILKHNFKVELVSKDEIEKTIGGDPLHQGIAALCAPLMTQNLEDFPITNTTTFAILDQVTDPHNVGAILRSAAAFNISALITPQRHSASQTAILAKSASGALELVPLIEVTNLSRAIDFLKKQNVWCIGLSEHGKRSFDQVDLKGPIAIVLGSEGSGLRRLVAEHCDELVHLKTSMQFSTLNVSNAAALCFWENFKVKF